MARPARARARRTRPAAGPFPATPWTAQRMPLFVLDARPQRRHPDLRFISVVVPHPDLRSNAVVDRRPGARHPGRPRPPRPRPRAAARARRGQRGEARRGQQGGRALGATRSTPRRTATAASGGPRPREGQPVRSRTTQRPAPPAARLAPRLPLPPPPPPRGRPPPPPPQSAVTPEVAKDLYYDMVLGREFEEMCAQVRRGHCHCSASRSGLRSVRRCGGLACWRLQNASTRLRHWRHRHV